ncbi:hypothetical protein WJX72_007950 [[Myrmecia] bisecta]|uniref:DUF7781 domain-containing protein n=1 Tax=[Myrmecia] bisecta TaxID=41462 RepID=A0AAW1Q1D5_9CHLO
MQEDRALSGDEAQSLSYSEASTDPLEDFLNRYSFTFSPAYCLKVRKSASGAIVGLNLTLTGPQQGVALKLKPCGGRVQRWVRKAVISQPNRDIRLYSAKIGIWKYLHVQFVGLHDFDSHRTSLSWKIKTKWAIDQHSILNKQKFAVNELLTLRTHSKIQHNMPELEGSVAVSRQQRDMDTNFERGYCHITIPKVEAVINLDNLRRYASRFRGRQPAPLPVGAEDAGSDPDADSELGSCGGVNRIAGIHVCAVRACSMM